MYTKNRLCCSVEKFHFEVMATHKWTTEQTKTVLTFLLFSKKGKNQRHFLGKNGIGKPFVSVDYDVHN